MAAPGPAHEHLTYKHAAQKHDVSRSTLKRMVKSGEIKAIKCGRRVLLVAKTIEPAIRNYRGRPRDQR
jgi:excisionase family DNA binding protein